MKQIYVIEMAFEHISAREKLNWKATFAVKTLQSAKHEVFISRKEEETEREKRRKKYGNVLYYTYYRYRSIILY